MALHDRLSSITPTLGKQVSPVIDEATGLTCFLDELTVTHSQGDELQNQVTELENEIEKLQKRIVTQSELLLFM